MNHKGEAFNVQDYAFVRGVCDAWDNPQVRSVALMWAARVGKTQTAMSMMVASIANDPVTFLYGNANETLVRDTVRDKWYPVFLANPDTRRWVPSARNRIETRIKLSLCQGYTAWSGSETQLADKDPRFLHAGEVDKWSKNKGDEADPLDLFLQRGAEIRDRKAIVESTPQIANRSRIESQLLRGWNCRFHVPCPHCNCYQQMIFGTGEPDSPGVIFEKLDGKLHAETARTSARYRCARCKKEIAERYRRAMVRAGVWVAEGQYADDEGTVTGTRINDGPHASFQLSRLYAPTFTWGDTAAEFIAGYRKGDMRDFKNSVMGETWMPIEADQPWTKIASRLCLQYDVST
jgi:phage terminase large subunit GpA-like protein